MRETRLPLAIVAASSLAAPAWAMDADTFYTKGVALQKRGMAAMFSSDLKLLRAEIDAASKAVKAENASAKSAGKPLYCPPADAQITSDQLLIELEAMPKDRRQSLTVRDAWRSILIRKFPCG